MKKLYLNIKFYFGNLPIRRKLALAFSILVIIPIIGTANLAYMKSRTIIEKKTSKYTHDILSATGDAIQLYFMNIERLSVLLLTDSTVQHGLNLANHGFKNDVDKYNEQKAIERVLFQSLISRDDIDSLYVISNSGITYSVTLSVNSILKTYSLNKDKKYLLRQAKGSIVWMDTDHNDRVIPVARAIYDLRNQKIIGYMVINIKEGNLYDLYKKLSFFSKGDFYIINRNKRIVSSGDKNHLGLTDNNGYTSNIFSKSSNSFFTYGINGRNYYISFDSLDLNHWILISKIPTIAFEQEVIVFRNWIIVIAIIFCLISFVISYILSENISKPIRRLSDQMRKVQQGNFDVNYSNNYTNEIGVLSNNFNQMIKKINYLIEEVYKEQLMKQQAELKSLRMQINPHFLYNTLESINWMARVNGVPEVGHMAKNLGDLMRYTISGEDFITLNEEIKNIQVYLAIQKYRFRDKFEVDIEIPQEILMINIPKLLLQPIIENAIVHGLEMKLGNGKIKITGSYCNKEATIKIEDDGVGIEPDKLKEILNENAEDEKQLTHSMIGLINVNRRIKLHYGANYGISIDSELNKGTTVTLHIPF